MGAKKRKAKVKTERPRASEAGQHAVLPRTNNFPKGSLEYRLMENFLAGGTWSIRDLVRIHGGELGVAAFHAAMLVLKNPLDPNNDWNALVERVTLNGEVYYRLVREIPLSVKDEWICTGKPPEVTVSWGSPGEPPEPDTPDDPPPPPQEPPADRGKESLVDYLVRHFQEKHPKDRRRQC